MKDRYEATISIKQKNGEKDMVHNAKYRFKWYAQLKCFIILLDFNWLITNGLITIDTQIIDLKNELKRHAPGK